MNICFIGHYTAGGTERATFMLANEFSNKHNVYLLNTCDLEPCFPLNKSLHVDYLYGKNIPSKILALFKYLKKNKIDIVITVEAMTGIITVPATKLAGCKHIIWEHANYFQNQGSRYIQRIRQLELMLVDAYIVLTNRDLNNFKQNFKCKTYIDYIYNIANPLTKRKYNINSKNIISVGHIRKIKNFKIIPDVGKIIFKEHPDWCWKIYGEAKGNEYESILSKVKEYQLEKNIIFCGRSNNMEDEYKNAAMYVMTSLQEGLPMVLLEAKSNILPIISFDIQTGPGEIICDGVNGYLIPAYDIKAMAEKICELIENEKKRLEFSTNAQLDIEKFSKEVIIKKWEDVINKITIF